MTIEQTLKRMWAHLVSVDARLTTLEQQLLIPEAFRPSEAQITYLVSLGIQEREAFGMTKTEARELLSRLVAEKEAERSMNQKVK